MNNTVKYTIVAAVIIIAAAFGIQSFVGQSPVPDSDLSTMAPAAGEEEGIEAMEGSAEAASSAISTEAVPPAPTAEQTTTAAPVEGAPTTTETAPTAQEPAAGAPVTEQPATPESVPSFEDAAPAEEPVEN